MKKEEFKVGGKVCLPEWDAHEYVEVFAGFVLDQDGVAGNIKEYDDDYINWQHWTAPEEKRKPETWYRFEFKKTNDRPREIMTWFKSLEEFKDGNFTGYEDINFDVEPRIAEEREF